MKKTLVILLAILAWLAIRKRPLAEEVTSTITYNTEPESAASYDDSW